MDFGDLLVWGAIIAFYLLSSLGRLLRGKDKPEEAAEARPPGAPQPSVPPPGVPRPPPGTPTPTARPEDALEEFLRRLGGDLAPELEPPRPEPVAERPVLSEHRPTPGEHVRTLSEHRRRPSEHRQAPGELRQAPSELRQAPSELRQAPGEVLPTLGEHRPTIGERVAGDVEIGPRLRLPPVVRPKRRASAIRRRLLRDFRDRDALAHAFVLREVLGPPVALRQGPPSDPQSR